MEGGAIGSGIYDRIQSGEISDNDLLKAYDENLRRVLKEVALLVDHISEYFDNIVIMGDHGEALGEYGEYKHRRQHPYVRVVPWGKINGIINKSNLPDRSVESKEVKKDDSSVEDRLRDLGYIG